MYAEGGIAAWFWHVSGAFGTLDSDLKTESKLLDCARYICRVTGKLLSIPRRTP